MDGVQGRGEDTLESLPRSVLSYCWSAHLGPKVGLVVCREARAIQDFHLIRPRRVSEQAMEALAAAVASRMLCKGRPSLTCLKTVDLPDSPAPNSSSLISSWPWSGGRGGRHGVWSAMDASLGSRVLARSCVYGASHACGQTRPGRCCPPCSSPSPLVSEYHVTSAVPTR